MKPTEAELWDMYEECVAMKNGLRHLEKQFNEGIRLSKELIAHYEGPDHPFVKGRKRPSKTKKNIIDIKDFSQ